MKVKVNKAKLNDKKTFPKLMQTEEQKSIILIYDFFQGSDRHCSGTVIKSQNYKVGSYHTDWVIDFLKDFEGSITLSND